MARKDHQRSMYKIPKPYGKALNLVTYSHIEQSQFAGTQPTESPLCVISGIQPVAPPSSRAYLDRSARPQITNPWVWSHDFSRQIIFQLLPSYTPQGRDRAGLRRSRKSLRILLVAKGTLKLVVIVF